jgi:ABC-type uncharacterized transport system permease subunit
MSEYLDLVEAPPGDEELAKKLELLGMVSLNFIENDGNVIFICLFYIAAVIWVLCAAVCCSETYFCTSTAKLIEKKLFFNAFIILLKESLIVTTICLLLGMSMLSTETTGQLI